MAFTRKFLSAMGIEADKVDEIINAHIEVVDGLKEERDNFKKDAEKLADVEKKLAKAEEKIAKNGDGETVSKEDYDKLKKEYDDYKADMDSKEVLRAKQTAYRKLAKAAELTDRGIEKAVKYANWDEIQLDKDGNIKDADKHTEFLKNEWSEHHEIITTRGANTANPPANSGKGTGKTKEEILAIKDGAIRRQEMLNNPHLFGLENK